MLHPLLPQLVLHMDYFRSVAMLQNQSNYLSLFSDLFLHANTSFNDALHQVLAKILSFLYADKGSIMLLNSAGNLVIEASTKSELVGLEIPESKGGVAWTVMTSKESLFVEDVKTDERFEQKVGSYTKDYFLSIPIFIKGDVRGVFNISDKLLSLLFDKIDEEIAIRFMGMLEPFFAIYLDIPNK